MNLFKKSNDAVSPSRKWFTSYYSEGDDAVILPTMVSERRWPPGKQSFWRMGF
jgi:hypothetical protein